LVVNRGGEEEVSEKGGNGEEKKFDVVEHELNSRGGVGKEGAKLETGSPNRTGRKLTEKDLVSRVGRRAHSKSDNRQPKEGKRLLLQRGGSGGNGECRRVGEHCGNHVLEVGPKRTPYFGERTASESPKRMYVVGGRAQARIPTCTKREPGKKQEEGHHWDNLQLDRSIEYLRGERVRRVLW